MNLNKIYFIPTDNFPSDINWPPENLPLIICTCRCLKKLYGVGASIKDVRTSGGRGQPKADTCRGSEASADVRKMCGF